MRIINNRSAARLSKTGAFLLLVGFAGAAPALAQENNFSGFRLELITGYDDEGVDFDEDVFDGGQNSQSGWLYGFGAGYDFQVGNLAFGIETELTDSSASRDELLTGLRPTNPIFGVPTPVTTAIEFEAGGDFYIGGRAGYAVTPKILLYGKIGYTRQKLAINGDGLDNGVPFSFDEKIKLDGFRFGLGGEYAFSKAIFAKAEYRYANYNNGDLDIRGADVDLDPVFNGIDIKRHQFALAVGYRF